MPPASSLDIYFTTDPQEQIASSHDFRTGPFFESVDPAPSSNDRLTFVSPSEKVCRLIKEYAHFKTMVSCTSVPSDWTSLALESLQQRANAYLRLDSSLDYLNHHLSGAKIAVLGYISTFLGGADAAEAFLRDVPPLDDSERWKRRLDCLCIVRIERERDAFTASWLPVLAAVKELKALEAPKHMSYEQLYPESKRISASDFGTRSSAVDPPSPTTRSSSPPSQSTSPSSPPEAPPKTPFVLASQSRAPPSAESDVASNADSSGERVDLLAQDLDRLADQKTDDKLGRIEEGEEQHGLETPLAESFEPRSTVPLSSHPNPNLRRRAGR